MRKFLLLIIVALFTTATYAQLWNSSISAISEGDKIDPLYPTVMDKDGNLYVTGMQTESLEFAGTTTEVLGIGAYIAKYDVNGAELFAITIHGGVIITAATTDADNNLYVAGMCEGQAFVTDVEGFEGGYELVGNEDELTSFIAKYDTNGNLLAIKSLKAVHNDFMKEMESWGMAMLEQPYAGIAQIVAEGSKVYVSIAHIGDVVVDDLTLPSSYKFVWDFLYIDGSNAAVVSFDSNLTTAVNEATITVTEGCAEASNILDFKFDVEGDNVYIATFCMGDVVLATSAGSEVFNFETTNDESGNVEIGAVVANLNEKAVKVSNKLAPVYGYDTYLSAMSVKNGKICLVGVFEGSCAFDNSKDAVGADDIFVSSIDANNLTIDWTYTNAVEADYEIVEVVAFGSENIYVIDEMSVNGEDVFKKYSVTYNGDVKEVEGVDAKGVACNENYVAFINHDYTTKYISMYAAEILTSSIEAVNAEVENNVIYDLTGRRIEKITESGIYIVNGKKVLVK
ncbi:MAG: hypothetical protein IKV07_03340 [Bacteroidaceae bacterium]|nr:hypothetical protein [Bacteroidaceae bacterium]